MKKISVLKDFLKEYLIIYAGLFIIFFLASSVCHYLWILNELPYEDEVLFIFITFFIVSCIPYWLYLLLFRLILKKKLTYIKLFISSLALGLILIFIEIIVYILWY